MTVSTVTAVTVTVSESLRAKCDDDTFTYDISLSPRGSAATGPETSGPGWTMMESRQTHESDSLTTNFEPDSVMAKGSVLNVN